jgi:hypothetical protein
MFCVFGDSAVLGQAPLGNTIVFVTTLDKIFEKKSNQLPARHLGLASSCERYTCTGAAAGASCGGI